MACGGVRTATGEVLFGICHASLGQEGAGGFNLGLGESRQYSSFGSGAPDEPFFGLNWSDPLLPHLELEPGYDQVTFMNGSAGSYTFTKQDEAYQAAYFMQAQLSYFEGILL